MSISICILNILSVDQIFDLGIIGVLKQNEDDQIFSLDIVGSFRLSEDRFKLYHFFSKKYFSYSLVKFLIFGWKTNSIKNENNSYNYTNKSNFMIEKTI